MKEIRDFLLENMPVPAQRECLHELYEATNGSEYVKINMQRSWDAFSAAYVYMERIYQIPIGSNLITEDIVSLDAVRDRILNAVDSIVDAQTKSPNNDVAAAARELAQTKVSFPVNPRAGYLTETGQLDTYLGVMLSEQLENMTKVGVLSPVQTLKAINDQIHSLVAERGDENVDKGQDLTRPQARGNAINAWRALVKYVNGYNIVVLGAAGANEELNRYIDTCNDINERYRSIYLHGAGNRPDGDESEEGEGGEAEEGGSNEEGGGQEENNLVNVVFMNAANEVLKTMQVPVGGTIQESDMPAIPSDMVWVPGLDGVNQMLAVAQPGSTVYCTQFREEY